jgi:prepilin-type N-terminal cleavage/methylation domain-containing protein
MARVRQTAFTVLELLIVIAIIALIAALLFPVFAGARKKARETQCMNNLHQIYIAWSLYTNDYQDTPPRDFRDFVPYITSREVLLCPDDRFGGFNSDATVHSGVPISYDYKGFLFTISIEGLRLIRERDHNFGILLCYLHGRFYGPLGPQKPNEAYYCGKVLRVRRDGSIQAVDVPLRAREGEQGRCLWELVTDLPIPPDYPDKGMEAICRGTIVCSR